MYRQFDWKLNLIHIDQVDHSFVLSYLEPSRTFVAAVTTVMMSPSAFSDTFTWHARSFFDDALPDVHADTAITTPTLYCDRSTILDSRSYTLSRLPVALICTWHVFRWFSVEYRYRLTNERNDTYDRLLGCSIYLVLRIERYLSESFVFIGLYICHYPKIPLYHRVRKMARSHAVVSLP